MISFDLSCKNDHVFEAWFPDGATFESQSAAKEIACPECGDTHISKALMAPNISHSGSRKFSPSGPVPEPGQETANLPAEIPAAADVPDRPQPHHMGMFMNALREMRRHVEKNSDDVGDTFAEEARKIHYGEAEERNIHGNATDEEAEELAEEGIEVAKIPWAPRHDS